MIALLTRHGRKAQFPFQKHEDNVLRVAHPNQQPGPLKPRNRGRSVTKPTARSRQYWTLAGYTRLFLYVGVCATWRTPARSLPRVSLFFCSPNLSLLPTPSQLITYFPVSTSFPVSQVVPGSCTLRVPSFNWGTAAAPKLPLASRQGKLQECGVALTSSPCPPA